MRQIKYGPFAVVWAALFAWPFRAFPAGLPGETGLVSRLADEKAAPVFPPPNAVEASNVRSDRTANNLDLFLFVSNRKI